MAESFLFSHEFDYKILKVVLWQNLANFTLWNVFLELFYFYVFNYF